MNLLLLGFAMPALEGDATGDQFGYALAGNVDFTGDGGVDLAVGAPSAGGVGAAYVYAGGTGSLDRVATYTGSGAGDEFGASLAKLGDVNGDGLDDLGVGAPGNAGAAYVVVDGTSTELTGAAGAGFGSALAGGDGDGDGYADVAVGEPGDAGAVYLFAGSSTGVNTSVITTWSGLASGDAFGSAVAMGDFDGDGYADLVVGAPGVDATRPDQGTLYAFSGKATGVGATAAWTGVGVDNSFGLGRQVVTADLDADGYDDVVASVAYGELQSFTALGSSTGLGSGVCADTLPDEEGSTAYIDAGADFDGDGAAERVYVVSAVSPSGSGCDWEERMSAIDSQAAGSATFYAPELSALAFAGDIDGNGVPDLAFGMPGGEDVVEIRLTAADADGDGYPADMDILTGDCDDADVGVHPGGTETDGDGVDGDCDGADDLPVETYVFVCPSFSTAAEAKVIYDDPEAAFGDPEALFSEVADALDALGCNSASGNGAVDACDSVTSEYLRCEVGNGAEAERLATDTFQSEWSESDGYAESSESTQSSLQLNASLDTPTAGGVAGAVYRGDSKSYQYSADIYWSYSSWWSSWHGTLRFADDTIARGEYEDRWSNGGECSESDESASMSFAGCTWSQQLASHDCDPNTYAVTDGAHTLVVTEDLGCTNAGPPEDTLLADLDGVYSWVDSRTWEAVSVVDTDGDGWPDGGSDCDESDPTVYPCAPDNDSYGTDYDCDGRYFADADGDGIVDDEDCMPDDPACAVCTTFYRDRDGDGWGDSRRTKEACTAPDGYVEQVGDCEDSDAQVSPGEEETCSGEDDNCDGVVDEGGPWYADDDEDDFGDASDAGVAACSRNEVRVADNSDCDDDDPDAHPGAAEVAGDDIDQDCDGVDLLGETGSTDKDGGAKDEAADPLCPVAGFGLCGLAGASLRRRIRSIAH